MDVSHHRMRFAVSFRVMRVDRKSGAETERLQGMVDGGSIERNQDTTVTESGSIDYVGDISGFANDLLRIWADLTYEDDTSESIALGTFLADGPKREISGGDSTVTPLSLYGRLRELSDDQFAQPLSVPSGSNPLDVVEDIITNCGLELAAHNECPYRLGSTWTFGMDTDTTSGSKLDAINELLDLAGWNAARTDPMGRVVLTPYVNPSDRASSWEFVEGAGARFLRSMTDERDWFDVANQVKVIYGNQDAEYVGIAVDDDPDSEFSTVTRGRVIGRTETYSDIPDGAGAEEIQSMADAKAAELLATERSVIRRVTFTHIYAPITLGDVVRLSYPSGGVDGLFAVRTQTIGLKAGLPVECEARSFERSG